MLTLSELMHMHVLEGEIFVRIWDDDLEIYSFNKLLREMTDQDTWVYSHTVKCIYPYDGAVAVELEKED